MDISVADISEVNISILDIPVLDIFVADISLVDIFVEDFSEVPRVSEKVPQSNLIALGKFKLGWMFVFGFFSQFLCYMQQRNWIIFSLFFVALSHCDTQNFGLWH